MSSTPHAIKKAVRDLLLTALPDFTVTWGFSTRNPPRKWCYMGATTFPTAENVTNRSRQFDMVIPIVLNALYAKSTPEDAEAYLWDQFDALLATFNVDSTLRSQGVITWIIEPQAVGTQPHTDGLESQAVLNLRVTYRQ